MSIALGTALTSETTRRFSSPSSSHPFLGGIPFIREEFELDLAKLLPGERGDLCLRYLSSNPSCKARSVAFFQTAVHPPSTERVVPVTKRPASDARRRRAPFSSLASPTLPIGVCWIM